ncbi:MAG TPA: peptidoglycan-associated lipoprotein Pal [Burkholderiales bacterium]|nr:peptidoglycan-associated lipoprotein Pal [Burkholderiales bacterium]
MRAVLIAALTAAAAAAFVAGCSTTPSSEQSPAGVEERKPAGAESKPIPKIDVTGKPGGSEFAVLKDPNNILSKRSIYYDFDKFDVKDEYRPLVEAHAKFLREHPTAKMLIQGNTDERGSREYNVGLGQRRSDGVKKMLSLLGVKEDQVESVSLGEEKPKSEGHDEQAWAQNRRSDMLYNGEY